MRTFFDLISGSIASLEVSSSSVVDMIVDQMAAVYSGR